MKVKLKIDDDADEHSCCLPGLDKKTALGIMRDVMQEKLLNVGDRIDFTIIVEEF